MTPPLPPAAPPPSKTLAADQATGPWPELTPTARMRLIEAVLQASPALRVTGRLDYTSPREPLLRDPETGDLVTLSGKRLSGGGPLAVTVTNPAGFALAGLPVWQIAALGLVGLGAYLVLK